MADEGKEHRIFTNGMRLGLLYDIMQEHAESDWREWELLQETKVRDEEEFGRFWVALCQVDAPNTNERPGYGVFDE
jgi:hypothetical protein